MNIKEQKYHAMGKTRHFTKSPSYKSAVLPCQLVVGGGRQLTAGLNSWNSLPNSILLYPHLKDSSESKVATHRHLLESILKRAIKRWLNLQSPHPLNRNGSMNIPIINNRASRMRVSKSRQPPSVSLELAIYLRCLMTCSPYHS